MKKIQLEDIYLSELFKQIGLLLHSGMLEDDSLRIISENESRKELKEFLITLADEISGGTTFSEAFEKSGVFSAHVTGFIRAGEQTGHMEETLASLSDYYRSKYLRKKKLIDSLTYPCILLVLTVIIIVILLTKVLPIFNDVYASLGGSLSGLAKGLMNAGNALNSALPYLAILFGILLIVISVILLFNSFKQKVFGVFTNIFGDFGVFRKMNNASFIQLLSVSVNSGLTVEEGIEMSSKLFSNNLKAKERCNKCLELIENGTNFDVALRDCGFLSSAASYILKLSISAGRSDEIMKEIAEQITEEYEDSIDELMSQIEPSLVVATSLVTGLILLSVMLPLIDIMKTIG